jgi:hypothetical protein
MQIKKDLEHMKQMGYSNVKKLQIISSRQKILGELNRSFASIMRRAILMMH